MIYEMLWYSSIYTTLILLHKYKKKKPTTLGSYEDVEGDYTICAEGQLC